MMRIILLLVALVVVVQSTPKTFNGHQVWRITPKTQSQLDTLNKLRGEYNDYVFWTDSYLLGRDVDVMVSPEKLNEFFTMLNTTSMDHKLFMHNVQYYIDQERPKERTTRHFDWTDYATLEEIHTWLRSLAQEHKEVELIEGGHSYEGRQILGIKLSYTPNNTKRAVFLEGGMHAREWIGTAVVTYTLNDLLTSPDPAVRALAESHDWYVFPVANPDGYEYTFTTNRMWRKTRTPYGRCAGADPNRNWDWNWNSAGTSPDPCTDIYAGPEAFSEIETRTLSAYIDTIAPNLIAYIAHHSYSQLLLIPFGVTQPQQYPENFNELLAVGRIAMQSLQATHGAYFETGNIVDILYPAAGGSMDWVKGKHDTRIVYTYELRDTGTYGFLLPPRFIIPSGEENMNALVTMFDEFDKRN